MEKPSDKFLELSKKIKYKPEKEQEVILWKTVIEILDKIFEEIKEMKRVQKEELHYEKENL